MQASLREDFMCRSGLEPRLTDLGAGRRPLYQVPQWNLLCVRPKVSDPRRPRRVDLCNLEDRPSLEAVWVVFDVDDPVDGRQAAP